MDYQAPAEELQDYNKREIKGTRINLLMTDLHLDSAKLNVLARMSNLLNIANTVIVAGHVGVNMRTKAGVGHLRLKVHALVIGAGVLVVAHVG